MPHPLHHASHRPRRPHGDRRHRLPGPVPPRGNAGRPAGRSAPRLERRAARRGAAPVGRAALPALRGAARRQGGDGDRDRRPGRRSLGRGDGPRRRARHPRRPPLCLRLLALVEVLGRARSLADLVRGDARTGVDLHPSLASPAAAAMPLDSAARFDETALDIGAALRLFPGGDPLRAGRQHRMTRHPHDPPPAPWLPPGRRGSRRSAGCARRDPGAAATAATRFAHATAAPPARPPPPRPGSRPCFRGSPAERKPCATGPPWPRDCRARCRPRGHYRDRGPAHARGRAGRARRHRIEHLRPPRRDRPPGPRSIERDRIAADCLQQNGRTAPAAPARRNSSRRLAASAAFGRPRPGPCRTANARLFFGASSTAWTGLGCTASRWPGWPGR